MQALVLLVGLAFKDENGLSVCESTTAQRPLAVSCADLSSPTVPLTPVEILWVIMITSSFPAMGLGGEKADPDVMLRKPHSVGDFLLLSNRHSCSSPSQRAAQGRSLRSRGPVGPSRLRPDWSRRRPRRLLHHRLWFRCVQENYALMTMPVLIIAPFRQR